MNTDHKISWPKTVIAVTGVFVVLFWGVACAPPDLSIGDKSGEEDKGKEKIDPAKQANSTNPDQSKAPKNAGYAVLGGGCFWCVEEVLHQLDGVTAVESGYAGGTPETANYESVCSYKTDHAEVVKVTFDRDKISYSQVLDTFWKLHDPTTVNRQGNDVGRQYRSVIFYQDEEEKKAAEASKKKLNTAEMYPSPVVTLIVPLVKFFPAEDYHQNYARLNPDDRYIQQVLFPKLKKLHLKLPGAKSPE